MKAMGDKAPIIQKSLGTGILPIVLGNLAIEILYPETMKEFDDMTYDLLENIALQGYVLVRNGVK